MVMSVFRQAHLAEQEAIMRRLLCLVALALTLPPSSNADFISGDMQLRDAIYIYNQPINSFWYTDLAGMNCDVLQMVLDVEEGHTEIWMHQPGYQNFELYPDAIWDYHAMFAYALYKNVPEKHFTLSCKQQTKPDYTVGRATVFGYCYSTKPDGKVYLWEEKTNTCTYSDGSKYSPCILIN
jgi:hypothetical protein